MLKHIYSQGLPHLIVYSNRIEYGRHTIYAPELVEIVDATVFLPGYFGHTKENIIIQYMLSGSNILEEVHLDLAPSYDEWIITVVGLDHIGQDDN